MSHYVFTYYEPILLGHAPLLDLWYESWSNHGWTPVVLGESQFRLHPFASEFERRVSNFPTVNDTRYELACFRRWLAMATIGGLITDYDVANRNFSPHDFEALPLSNLTVLCEHRVPCVVFGTQKQYAYASSKLAHYQVRDDDLFEGRKLVEDMTILRRLHPADWFSEVVVCKAFGTEGDTPSPLVHCCAASCGKERVKSMLAVMNERV